MRLPTSILDDLKEGPSPPPPLPPVTVTVVTGVGNKRNARFQEGGWSRSVRRGSVGGVSTPGIGGEGGQYAGDRWGERGVSTLGIGGWVGYRKKQKNLFEVEVLKSILIQIDGRMNKNGPQQ